MLCQKCPLKSECTKNCAAQDKYVKSKANFRATSSSKDVIRPAIPEEAYILCQKCSLKNECQEICEDVRECLKPKYNYVTSHEVSLDEFPEGSSKIWDQSNDPFKRTKYLKRAYYALMPVLWEFFPDLPTTDRQREILDLYLSQGLSMAEIGQRLGISDQAVNYAIFGHPKQGGGIVRKVQNAIAADERFKNYL